MRTIQFWAAAAAALLLLAGCTHEMKTAVVSDEGTVPFRENSEASLSYNYSIEYITGGVPQEVQDKINRTIISSEIFYDGDPAEVTVPEACAQWAERTIEGYKSDTASMAEDFDWQEDAWMFNWEFGMNGEFTTACKARKLQSYLGSDNDYTGGAHGSFGLTYWVFDMTTGDVVRQEDLFTEGFADDEDVCALLLARVLDSLDEDFSEEDLFGSPYPNDNFCVDEDGVTWVYNPYEIAPYVMGVLEAKLTWEELKPYLKR